MGHHRRGSMIRVRFRYVVEDVDRHGNVRLYFRRRGEPKVRLPGLPGSEQFMEAYQDALNRTLPKVVNRRQSIGSFGYVCRQYYTSQTFKALDESTRRWRRRALDEIALQHGEKPVAKMQPKHV